MRLLGVICLAATALAVGASGAAATPSATTSLTVTYWPDGAKTSVRSTWTLRCNPPRGTHPRPAVACRRLAAGGTRLFAPLPKDAVCTQIYGGPQVARVVGLVAGKRIWATFRRTDGCHISRWDGLSPWLLPSGAA